MAMTLGCGLGFCWWLQRSVLDRASKPLVALQGRPFRAENRGWLVPADAVDCLIFEVVSKPGAGSQVRAVQCCFEHED